MSNDTTRRTFSTETAGPEETERLAAQLGQQLKGGEVIELVSDLGGGKTAFTRGLARGAGSKSHVSSPTFKISNTYKAPNFDIVHYDFYRLPEAGLMQHELVDVLGDPNVVVVVEWSEVVKEVLPKKRLKIDLRSISETDRSITFYYPSELAYLLSAQK